MARVEDEHRETVELRERMETLAPVLRTLPPGTQVCFIQDGNDLLLYNVSQAFELFGRREPAAVINVAERAKLIHPRGSGPLREDEVQIDPDHALTVDLSYPVLLVECLDEVDGSRGRVIDGWHRIYRASQLGIAELPAVVITADEESSIRIDPHVSEG